jgi:peptide/nickel transport system substrate-binding protein
MSEGITKIQTAILVFVIIVAVVAGGLIYYFTIPAPSSKTGGNLVVANWGDAKTLNPGFQYDSAQNWMDRCIYDPLVALDAEYNVLLPGLAKDWDIASDGLTYTFHLYDNVTWHDGVNFTAADVKWTFDTILNQTGIAYYDIKGIEKVEVVNDFTVKFTLYAPNAAFMGILGANDGLMMLPKHIYEGTDWTTNPHNFEPVGTGPFKFKEWVKGDHITFEANENYFRGRPYLDTVVWKVYADPTTALVAFEAGEVQYLMYPPGYQDIKRLSNTAGVTVIPWHHSRNFYLGINHLRAPLDNVNVRWAVAYAINRSEIVEKAFYGLFEPGKGIISAYSWAFDPNSTVPECDPEKAKQLLDEAGYTEGTDGVRFQLEILAIPGYGSEDICDIMKQNLAKVGIDLKITITEWAVIRTRAFASPYNYDLAILYTGSPFDPDYYLRYFVSGAPDNRGYNNTEIDQLFQQAREITDKAQRIPLYHRIQEIILADMIHFNIIEYPALYPFNSKYTGFPYEPDNVGKVMLLDFSKIQYSG